LIKLVYLILFFEFEMESFVSLLLPILFRLQNHLYNRSSLCHLRTRFQILSCLLLFLRYFTLYYFQEKTRKIIIFLIPLLPLQDLHKIGPLYFFVHNRFQFPQFAPLALDIKNEEFL